MNRTAPNHVQCVVLVVLKLLVSSLHRHTDLNWVQNLRQMMPPQVSSAISVVYGDQQGSAAAAVEEELVHMHPYQEMNPQSRTQFGYIHKYSAPQTTFSLNITVKFFQYTEWTINQEHKNFTILCYKKIVRWSVKKF